MSPSTDSTQRVINTLSLDRCKILEGSLAQGAHALAEGRAPCQLHITWLVAKQTKDDHSVHVTLARPSGEQSNWATLAEVHEVSASQLSALKTAHVYGA